MQVILQKQVDKLGHPGDVKNVSAGYFRNFLFPRGLAQSATASSLKGAEQMRLHHAQQQVKDQESFRAFAEAIQKDQFIILRKATDEGHLFGSVTEQDIAALLAHKGYHLNEKHIHLETHIKELGTYPVLLKFDESLTGTFSLAVERDTS